MIEWMGIFLAGLLTDIIATIDIQAVQRGEALKSALATFILTFLGYTIFYYIVLSPEAIWNIVLYALGGGMGAFITIKYAKHRIK